MPNATRKKKKRSRQGNILILMALMLVALLGIIAFAVDIGVIATAKGQLQRTADAAALAGASAIYVPQTTTTDEVYALAPKLTEARYSAQTFAASNNVMARSPFIDLNASNQPDGDIILGRLDRYWDQSEPLDPYSDMPNSVQVTVRLADDTENGSLALYFARALGVTSTELQATATATVWYPALLPFATSESNWQSLGSGGAGDHFAHDPDSISFGVDNTADGVPEIVMFPGDWDGQDMPPGNFGIIQIGPEGDVLTNLRRQIDRGPSLSDIDYHGGSLRADEQMPGHTGIKSSTKHAFLGGWADGTEFAGMIGQVRTLPIYKGASGNGANANFTLSRFVLVRILSIRIDTRWRIDRYDSEGDEITGVVAQPLTDRSDVLQSRLTR